MGKDFTLWEANLLRDNVKDRNMSSNETTCFISLVRIYKKEINRNVLMFIKNDE